MGESAPGKRERLERLAAGRDAELPERALHVGADRVLGDEEALRDLVGAQVLVEQEQHLDLAGRERRGDLVGDAGATAVAVSYPLEQPPRDRAGEGGLALGGPAKELRDPLRALALQQVAGSAALDRGEQVLLGAGSRQHDDLALRGRSAEPGQGAE